MRTMCARVVMLAAVLSGAVPIAARTEPDEKIDSNIADWVETCKLRFIGHLCTSGRPQIRAFQSFQNQQEFCGTTFGEPMAQDSGSQQSRRSVAFHVIQAKKNGNLRLVSESPLLT